MNCPNVNPDTIALSYPVEILITSGVPLIVI